MKQYCGFGGGHLTLKLLVRGGLDRFDDCLGNSEQLGVPSHLVSTAVPYVLGLPAVAHYQSKAVRILQFKSLSKNKCVYDGDGLVSRSDLLYQPK